MGRSLIELDAFKVSVAETLNRLPEVRWDRLTTEGEEEITIYGWVARDDGRADFVLIRFGLDVLIGGVDWWQWWTSSAELSESIYERMTGQQDGHNACHRVDDTFGDLVPNSTTSEAA